MDGRALLTRSALPLLCTYLHSREVVRHGDEILSLTDGNGNRKARLRCASTSSKKGWCHHTYRSLGLVELPSCRAHLEQFVSGYFESTVNEAALVGYMNSSLVDILIWALTPDRKHEAGIIATFLFRTWCGRGYSRRIGSEILAVRQNIRTQDETDPLYRGPHPRADEYLAGLCAEAIRLQQEIDGVVARLWTYG